MPRNMLLDRGHLNEVVRLIRIVVQIVGRLEDTGFHQPLGDSIAQGQTICLDLGQKVQRMNGAPDQ